MFFSEPNGSYPSGQNSGEEPRNFSSFSSSFSGETTYTPLPSGRDSFESTIGDSSYIGDGSSSFEMVPMPNDSFSGLPNMMWPHAVADFMDNVNGLPFIYPQLHTLSLNTTPLVPFLVSDPNSPLSELGSSHYSELGTLQDDFIDPSQTFIDSYDSHSPTTIIKFDHSSPISHYSRSSKSPSSSMSYSMSFRDGMSSASTTPSRSSPLRQPILDPLETSAALQRVQSEPRERRTHKKRMRESVGLLGNTLRIQNRALKKCSWEGCNAKFQRQEHLKRHEKTHINAESFPCQFCNKPFGRSDNLKSHIKLHTHPEKKSSRTKYFKEAAEVWEQMNRKPRRTQEHESGVKKEPDAPSTRSRVIGL